jgi:hypothetical protein
LIQEITPLKGLEKKLDYFFSSLPALENNTQHYKGIIISIVSRLRAISGYEWDSKKTVKSHTTLLRLGTNMLKTEEDYGLSKVGRFIVSKLYPNVIYTFPVSGSI